MEPQEKLTTQEFVVSKLRSAQKEISAKGYDKALDLVREAKAADSKNIYIIAIEKQIAKLLDKALIEAEKAEVLESIPAMIERAIGDVQRRPAMAKTTTEEKGKDEKEQALEKLKRQYIQRAAEYIEKKEYQHALEEIKRIYIIEPESKVAKEYEQKISQLMSLQRSGEAEEKRTTEVITTGEKPIEEIVREQVPSERPKVTEERLKDLLLEEEPPKSKLPVYLSIGIVVVLAIVLGVWLIISKKGGESQPTQPSEVPAITQMETPTPSQNMEPAPSTQAPKSNVPVKQEKTDKETKQTKALEPAETKIKKPSEEPKPQPAVTESKATASKPAETKSTETKPATTTTEHNAPEKAKTPESEIPQVFVPIESPPKIVKKEAAVYPDFAIKLGLEGKVVVEVTVDPQGRPIQAKVVKSDNEIFNDAAVDAAMKSQYEPAMMSTGPVTATILVPFNFKLKR